MNIKTLLQLVLDELIENPERLRSGLCLFIYMMYVENIINWEELNIIHKFILNNPPSVRTHFPYYWKRSVLQPRIDYLTEHINTLENERNS